MKRPADTIACPHCNGRGSVPVTGIYADTLTGLRRLTAQGRDCVANRDAFFVFGCKPTALNNRLAWLEAHGFARSEKYGRQRRFYAMLVESIHLDVLRQMDSHARIGRRTVQEICRHQYTEGPCCWIFEETLAIRPILTPGKQGLWSFPYLEGIRDDISAYNARKSPG